MDEMLTSILEQSLLPSLSLSSMAAIRLSVSSLDSAQEQTQGSNPQHQDLQQLQTNPWVQDGANGSIVVSCCQNNSPYHTLISGHLIYSQSKGCGRTCREAVNEIERLWIEFCCDWCSDEEVFDETMDEIRKCWSEMNLDNRILLLEHLQPYIDDFEYRLTLGRRARIGRRGRKAFARPDEKLVERFQTQIEELIKRSCHYFLQLIIDRKGDDMYDERHDEGDGNGESAEELLDEAEEGEIEDRDTGEDKEDTANVPDLAQALSLRPIPQSSSGVQHRLSVVEDLLGSVVIGDSFESVEKAVEAEEERRGWQHKCRFQ